MATRRSQTAKNSESSSQRNRFIEAARKVGASEDEADFDRALKKVAKKKLASEEAEAIKESVRHLAATQAALREGERRINRGVAAVKRSRKLLAAKAEPKG